VETVIGPITAEDVKAGFRSGVQPLDDYLKRHALTNDRAGISRCFVLRPEQADLPQVSGFYTLSMAAVQADALRAVLKDRLPRYPLPVAIIDALSRVVGVAESIACLGVIVDAYLKYDFVTVEGEGWPRRMFLPIATARAAAVAAGPQP
jgi:hypothetical protein